MELIRIDIEIRKHSRTKEFFSKTHERLEDMMFSIMQHIPQKIIPSRLMNWFNRYTDKRIEQLKQEAVKMSWQNLYLQNSLTELINRQQDAKEAPSDD